MLNCVLYVIPPQLGWGDIKTGWVLAVSLKLVSSKIDLPLIAPSQPWLRPAEAELNEKINMDKVKIPNEEKIKKLLVHFVKDIEKEVAGNPQALGAVIALMVGATVTSGNISGEEIMNRIVIHLIENNMLHPEELSLEEIQAMQEIPKKEFLN